MPGQHRNFQQRGFAFACEIVRFYRIIESSAPRPMSTQLLRAGTSVAANLEEAKSAQSRRDLVAKFSIALQEAREARFWLRLLAATDTVSSSLTQGPLALAEEMVAVLTVSVIKLKRGLERPRRQADAVDS